jgi:hypothetical protein
VSSLLQEVAATSANLRLRLEECADQVKAKNRVVKDIQKGNRELLQKNCSFSQVAPVCQHGLTTAWLLFKNS